MDLGVRESVSSYCGDNIRAYSRFNGIGGYMETQMSMFDMLYEDFSISNKIRLISLFSGYDSQAMGLRNIGADFEHYKAIEIEPNAIKCLNAIHGTDFKATDIKEIGGVH